MRQKCVNCSRDIYVPKCENRYRDIHGKVPKLFLQKIWMLQQTANNKIFVEKVSRLFGNFPDTLESFQTVRKLSTLSENFPHCQENFQTIWKLSGTTGNFPDRLETFQTIWKLSGPTGNFPDRLETFQTVLKLCRQSGNSPHFSSVDVKATFYG